LSGNSAPPAEPARGWRHAGRVSAGGSVFVGGTREAKSVWGGRERYAYRGPRTLTEAAHASRWSLPLLQDDARRDGAVLGAVDGGVLAVRGRAAEVQLDVVQRAKVAFLVAIRVDVAVATEMGLGAP